MGRVLTRAEWNDIIQRINNLAANRPNGCPEFAPLPEVETRHKWSQTDILVVMNRLHDMCNDNLFTTWSFKWKQGFIDEIEAAIQKGWCGCEDQWTGPYDVDFPLQSENINEVEGSGSWQLGEEPGHNWCWSNYSIWPVGGSYTNHWWDHYTYWPAQDLQVGPPGITGRIAKFHFRGHLDWSESMHQWMTDHFEDWSASGSEPYNTDGGGWPVQDDGVLRLTKAGLATLHNLYQDVTSNCPDYEFHTEQYRSYSVESCWLSIERP